MVISPAWTKRNVNETLRLLQNICLLHINRQAQASQARTIVCVLVATFSRLFLFVLILALCFLTLLIIHRKSKSHLVLSHLDMHVSTTIINSAIPHLLCVILVVWHNFKRLSLSATCYLASCHFAKLVGETCGSSANSVICGCKKLCKKIPKTTQKGEFCLTKILGNTITLIGLRYTLSRSPWPALSHSRQLFHSTGVLLPKELQSDLK